MLKLDHLVIIAPSLEAGAAHVRGQLGIEMASGGKHPQMGTHNLLLRLGEEVFLEVIAIDRAARRPNRPRWFGLDDTKAVKAAFDDGRRLRGWVARTGDLQGVLARHGDLLGQRTHVSRGDRDWGFSLLPDGALPAGGVVPPAIDWGGAASPARAMPDLGARLLSFEIEHPDPDLVSGLYRRLDLVNPPKVLKGRRFRYRATIATETGIKELY